MTADTEAQSTAITRREPQSVALQHSAWTLASMSDEEFSREMEMGAKGRERLQIVMRSMMKEGVHFGKIPGTQRDVLLKPGGEVLCQMFRLVPDVTTRIEYGDGKLSPHITVTSRCVLHHGSIEGPVVAVGEAAGTSWEKKWRYRLAERICPTCGKAGAIIKGKDEYGGGWLCYAKRGGCATKWPDGDAAIEGQQLGQVENPDPYELLNTIVKITNKRARIDAIITGTASSDLLTQDVEEGIAGGAPAPDKRPVKSQRVKHDPNSPTDMDAVFGADSEVDPELKEKRQLLRDQLLRAADTLPTVRQTKEPGRKKAAEAMARMLCRDVTKRDDHPGYTSPGQIDSLDVIEEALNRLDVLMRERESA